jgi:hypothetical protein
MKWVTTSMAIRFENLDQQIDSNPPNKEEMMSSLDHSQTDSAPDSAAQSPPLPTRQTARSESMPKDPWTACVNDYRAQSQRQANRHLAVLGAATADLLQIRGRLVTAINQAMDEEPPTMADVEDYAPAIGQLLSLDKQIQVSSQLQLNLKKLELSTRMPVPGPANNWGLAPHTR